MPTSSNERTVEPAFDSAEARVEMRRRHLEIAFRMQAVALYALEALERKAAAGKPLGLRAEEAEKLLDAGRKLERAAMGDAQEAGDAVSIASKEPN